MHRIVPSCLGALALALAATPAPAPAAEPFQLVTIDDVSQMLGAPDVRLYDANTREVFEQAHLPGATFVQDPLAALLPRDKGVRLVFYCKNPR